MRFAVAALLLFLAPEFALGAGFAKQSLFLSKSPVTEGEQVFVHAVVQNDAAVKFDGDLIFSIKGQDGKKERIGSVAVLIAASGAQAASVSWTPPAGDQTVVAALTQKDGTVVEEEEATFSIAKKPTPVVVRTDPADTQSVEPSDDVQAMISKFIPPISGLTEPVFTSIDTFRIKANSLINNGIAWSKNKIGGKSAGQVLGSATSKDNTTPKGILDTVIFLAAMLSLYVLSILKWMVTHTGVFYPAAAILFLFVLWKIFSSFRRPSY